jgi:excisionase family DNA binding protein
MNKQQIERRSPWLTVGEAAKRLKLSPRTLRNYMVRKKITYHQSETGTKRFTIQDIDSFLKPVRHN